MRSGKEYISFSPRCHCALATSIEFSPRPFHASAITMVRSCYVVEDSITLLTRSFGSLHVLCTFGAGSHRVCVTFSEFSINSESNSLHHHLTWTWIRNFCCNLFCFKDIRLYLMHKLHLYRWEGEEGERIEDNLNAGCIVLHTCMLTQESLQMRTRGARRSIYKIRKDAMRMISAWCDLNGRSKNRAR